MPKINKRKKKEEKLVLESQKTSQRKTLVISAISIGVLLVLAGIIAPVALKVKYSGTFDVIQLSLLHFGQSRNRSKILLGTRINGKRYF
ncbi:MAG: hypothetical protein ACTSQX_08310 [Candidatus Heimdallarchaeota archaeon]